LKSRDFRSFLSFFSEKWAILRFEMRFAKINPSKNFFIRSLTENK